MKQWLTFWRGVAALVLAFGLYATFVRFVRATESQTGCEAEIIDGYFIKNESE